MVVARWPGYRSCAREEVPLGGTGRPLEKMHKATWLVISVASFAYLPEFQPAVKRHERDGGDDKDGEQAEVDQSYHIQKISGALTL